MLGEKSRLHLLQLADETRLYTGKSVYEISVLAILRFPFAFLQVDER